MERRRIDFVDGIRAVAALFVVVHHVWLSTFPTYPSFSGPWWAGWMIYGHFAVSVFIVVSGYSLSIAPARHHWELSNGPVHFMYRRAWRIVPTYWAALLASCAVVMIFAGMQLTTKDFVVHALLLQDLVANNSPNGAFWSIAIEWHIYFFFPLFLLVRRRSGAIWLVAVVTAGVMAGYILATNVGAFHKFVTISPQYAALFVMGMAAATFVNHAPTRSPMWLPILATAALAAFVGICAVEGPEWVVRQFFWTDLLVGAAAALFVASLTTGHPSALRNVFASRPFAGVGAFSYSIYLIHAPIVWLLWHYLFSRIDWSRTLVLMLFLLTTLPVVIASSWLFYLVFEKPFLTRRSWAEWRQWLRTLARRDTTNPDAEVVSP